MNSRFRQAFLLMLCLWGGALSLAPSAAAGAQDAASPIFIDARHAPAPVQPLPFAIGGTSPDGHVLSANQRYLTFDGKPWFPVMGEFHYARYPESEWEEEILKMKAGGVNIVSTYVFWIYHEELQGQFDWSGRRDLRRFFALCAKHGMYVWLRVGPWAHGEVRNGGLPDWLVQSGLIRQDDPQYLQHVARFYGQIGAQVQGQFWKDGGPIIGVQIENEYNLRGPGKGAQHMLTLLQLAKDAGLDAPFYSATGWDDADVPAQQFLPVFSGYADGFWKRYLGQSAPSPNYFFTNIRGDENVRDNLRSKRPDIDKRFAGFPFLTAEMGAGMAQSYHRRPLISADDSAAMVLVKLGSGVTMYGYYMFHGGTNPDGKLTTLQESQATGYPNDVPAKSYDFQAPLGEFGQVRPLYGELKEFNLFLNDFGSMLAPMPAYFPRRMPKSLRDTQTARVSARLQDGRGFLFINNYERNYPLAEHRNFQVRLKTPSRQYLVPRHPIDVPSGVFTIWPVNLDLGGTDLEYATAQLMCRLPQPDTYVFFSWPGVRPEFVFSANDGDTIEAPRGRVTREGSRVVVDQLRTGPDVALRIRHSGGQVTQILLLPRDMAGTLWKSRVAGQERLLNSTADVYFAADEIHLLSSDPAQLTFGVYPALRGVPEGFSSAGTEGLFARLSAHVASVEVAAKVQKIQDAGSRSPITMGREVAALPGEAAFSTAAKWTIQVPPVVGPGVKNAILRIKYQGDIARLYDHGKLLDDDFYKGTPWEIGLNSLTSHDPDPALELSILPLPENAPVYLPPGAAPAFPADGQVANLIGVTVVPEYEAVASVKP
jgi:beta-galactosidase